MMGRIGVFVCRSRISAERTGWTIDEMGDG